MSAYRSVGNVANRQKSSMGTAFTQVERTESYYDPKTPEPTPRNNEPPPLRRQKSIRPYSN